MAIKISGTTVIDNSRVVSNVGGLKTVAGQSILGTGNITFGSGLTVGSVQYTAYSPNIGLADGSSLLAGIVEPPSTGIACHIDYIISTPTVQRQTRTKYRTVV